jgi:hypothetical protein
MGTVHTVPESDAQSRDLNTAREKNAIFDFTHQASLQLLWCRCTSSYSATECMETAATPSCLTSWKMAVTYSSWNMELYSHAYIALARLCFPYSTVLFDQIFKGLLLNYCFSSPCFCRWHRQLELSRMQALQCRQVREHTAYAELYELWTMMDDGCLNSTLWWQWLPAVYSNAHQISQWYF